MYTKREPEPAEWTVKMLREVLILGRFDGAHKEALEDAICYLQFQQTNDYMLRNDISHAANQLTSLPQDMHNMTKEEIVTYAVDMGEEILYALTNLQIPAN